MKILTGDETGLLKLINVNKKQVVNVWGTQTRENSVARASWLPAGTDDAQLSSAKVAVLTKKGVVNVWDTASGSLLHSCGGAGEDGAILAHSRGRFITCSGDGFVRIFSQSAKDADANAKTKFSVKSSIACARFHAARGLLAVGGREHDLSLWDLETQQPVFEARNVGQTTLSLRVPVWVSGLQFLPELGASAALNGVPSSALAPESSSGFTLVTVTGHRHVRIYDTRATDRRPVRSVDMGEHPFTAVEMAPDGRSVLTGDAVGTLRRIELDTLRQNGGYKGVGGSVRALAVHPTQPVFATVGLDRALRVHHVKTRRLLRRVHLKQRLTAVLIAPESSKAAPQGDDEDEEEEEEEEEEAAADMEPEPLPDRRIRITQLPVDAKDGGRQPGAAGGEEDEDGDVWKELERRAALVKAGSTGVGKAAKVAPAAVGASAKRVRPASASEDEDEEDDEDEDDDDEDDDSDDGAGGAENDEDALGEDSDDDEDDDLDDGIDGDNDGAAIGADGQSDEDEDGDDSDQSSDLGFSDEEEEGGKGAPRAKRARGGNDDDDDDDGDEEESEEEDEDEQAEALVDSRKTAKVLLNQTKVAQMAKQKEAQRAAIAKGKKPVAAQAHQQHKKPAKKARR